MELKRIKKGNPYLFSDVQKWGGKGDNLLKLSEVFDVPQGFVISSEAYQKWLKSNDLEGFLNDTMQKPNPEQAYNEIKQRFSKAKFNRDLTSRLESEFKRLNGPLAVRSSSVSEDGTKNSFAGQHESILGITDFDEFLGAINEVYASLFTPRAIEYRQNQNISGDDSIAIVTQEMINPVASGVAYSPSPNNLDEILIESSWGLCTSVVDGRTCDIYRVLNTVTGNIISDISPKKTEAEVFNKRKKSVVNKKVPFFKIKKSSLDEKQVLEVAKTAKSIERAYGCPMDMEFAYNQERKNLYVLQARPLTGTNRNQQDIVIPNIPQEKILATSRNTRNQGVFEGPAVVVRGVDHINRRFDIDGDLIDMNQRYSDGYILLSPEIPPQLEQHVTNAKAMYSTECGTTGHAAAIAVEKGIIYLGRGTNNIPDLLSSVRSGDQIGIAVSKNQGTLYRK